METILGLMLILLPLIFKAVEKKLQASGKSVKKAGNSGLPEEDAEYDVQPEDDAGIPSEVYAVLQETGVPEIREAAAQKIVHRKAESVPCRPAVMPQKPAAAVAVSPAEKNLSDGRIDPKKLILYSEIMKPKYNE